MKPFAIVINFSMTRMWGKIGPFEDWKAVHEWSAMFRKAAVEKNADLTALSGELFEAISEEICCQDYLPSKDPAMIISNALATSLIGPK